jgi:hypothetical protein
MHFNSAGSDSPHGRLAFEDVDDAAQFNADNGHLAGRLANQTTEKIDWTASDLGVGFSTSPSLVASLQQVVNRAGFDAGTVALIWGSLPSPNDDSVIAAYDGSTANAGKLDIDYTAGEPEPEPDETRLPFRSNRKAVEFDIVGLINNDDIKTGLFCLSETTWELAYNLVLWYGAWRSRYYFIDTDDSLKTITDDEYQQILEIYQLAVEELQMGDLNEGLNAIANAISELADRDCCGAASGVSCGSGGATGPGSGSPSPLIDNGTNPDPDSYENYAAYQDYKCRVAEHIVNQMQSDIDKLQLLNWGTITLYGVLELTAVIAATVATPIFGDEVLAVVGALALLSGAISGPLDELETAITAIEDDLKCIMYLSQNASVAKQNMRLALAAELDTQTTDTVLFVAQQIGNMFLSFASLNRLFDLDETISYPSSVFDCDTCLSDFLLYEFTLNNQGWTFTDNSAGGDSDATGGWTDIGGGRLETTHHVDALPSAVSLGTWRHDGFTPFAITGAQLRCDFSAPSDGINTGHIVRIIYDDASFDELAEEGTGAITVIMSTPASKTIEAIEVETGRSNSAFSEVEYDFFINLDNVRLDW